VHAIAQVAFAIAAQTGSVIASGRTPANVEANRDRGREQHMSH
jgi:hypothetical protein